jgi:hypothetical protein
MYSRRGNLEREAIMKIKAAYLAAALLAGSAPMAFAQGGSTDAKGNANGSQHVGSGGGATTGGATTGGAMQGGTHGTTGMSTGPERGSPNGSPGAMPKATTGPQGDTSKTESGPK